MRVRVVPPGGIRAPAGAGERVAFTKRACGTVPAETRRRLEFVRHMTLSVDIPRDPTAPAAARRAVEGLADRIDESMVPDVKLLVSELVSNSVKYGGDGQVTLQITTRGPRRLRVEVIDKGAGFVPLARDRPMTEAGGWGLHLVQTLSDRWGVREGSTLVWFEIAR